MTESCAGTFLALTEIENLHNGALIFIKNRKAYFPFAIFFFKVLSKY